MEAGQDCFLDIVSNIVGILIILVMVAGVRAKSSAPRSVDEDSTQKTQVAVSQLHDSEELRREFEHFLEKTRERDNAQRETLSLVEEVKRMNALTSARARERVELTALIQILKGEYDLATEQFSEAEKEMLNMKLEIQQLEDRLAELERTKTWLEQERPQATVLENMPTSLTKTVEKNEAHFRIKHGRVVHVPFDACAEVMIRQIQSRFEEGVRKGELRGTIGPVEDFTMPYRAVFLSNVPVQTAHGTGMGHRMEFAESEMIPRQDVLGETLEQALLPHSQFRKKLAVYPQGKYTVTFWVYPDSFGTYSELKKLLYSNGYQTAARPLNEDEPIGASSEGSKSVAQ